MEEFELFRVTTEDYEIMNSGANFSKEVMRVGDVVFEGTIDEINSFAKKNHLIFKKDNSLFGGYYVDSKTMDEFYVF